MAQNGLQSVEKKWLRFWVEISEILALAKILRYG